VRYLQLAHNERHQQSGNSVAKVIHNFGRADQVDREGLARLVSSISRFLTPEQAAAAAACSGVRNSTSPPRPAARSRSWTRAGYCADLDGSPC